MRALALVATLAMLGSCAAPAKPPPGLPAALLAACDPPVAEPVPPPKPRTVDSIAAWGNHEQLALRLANHRLAACEQQRGTVIRELTKPAPSPTETQDLP